MTTVDELLKKQKGRLEKMSASVSVSPPLERKKIIRTGPARPWQENLPQYQNQTQSTQPLLSSAPTEQERPTMREQTVSIASPKAYAEPLASVSSSSSSYVLDNFKTTTSESGVLKNESNSLPADWLEIDFSTLTDIGFTQTHLIQIVRQGKLSPNEVQESIEYFTFDLKRNGLKPNGPALNFFMGILRKGIPYAPPENFESPSDEARRKIKEFKEKKQRARVEEEQKIFELEFQEWRSGLSNDQVISMVPEFAKRPGPMQESTLRSYFEKEIWPEKYAMMPGMTVERSKIQQEIEQSLAGDGS